MRELNQRSKWQCAHDGCTNDALARHRHVVCDTHSAATEVVINGESKRFCKACKHLEALSAFIGNNRTCTARLARNRSKRLKRQRSVRDENQEGAENQIYQYQATGDDADSLKSASLPAECQQLEDQHRPFLSFLEDPRDSAEYALPESSQEHPSQALFDPMFASAALAHCSSALNCREGLSANVDDQLDAAQASTSDHATQHEVSKLGYDHESNALDKNNNAALHSISVKVFGYEPHQLSAHFYNALAEWLFLRPVCVDSFVCSGCVEVMVDYVSQIAHDSHWDVIPLKELQLKSSQVQVNIDGVQSCRDSMEPPRKNWPIVLTTCGTLIDKAGNYDIGLMSSEGLGGSAQKLVVRTGRQTKRRTLDHFAANSAVVSVHMQTSYDEETYDGVAMVELIDEHPDKPMRRTKSLPLVLSHNEDVIEEVKQVSLLMQRMGSNTAQCLIQQQMAALLHLIGQGLNGKLSAGPISQEVKSVCTQLGWNATCKCIRDNVP